MLLKITSQCSMMCKHCMNASQKKGNHMEKDTFFNAIRFANRLNTPVLMLSGGEPTEHPNFRSMLVYALANFNGKVLVTTHGKWLLEDKSLVKDFPEVMWQVTNDQRYYPFLFPRDKAKRLMKSHKNLHIFFEIGSHLYPQGRAVSYLKMNQDKYEGVGSKCFNLRSLTNTFGSFEMAVMQLRMGGKFCTPSVRWDGSVAMGESDECPSIGTVTDFSKVLTDAICNSQCNKCGCLDKLDKTHWDAIGYKGVHIEEATIIECNTIT